MKTLGIVGLGSMVCLCVLVGCSAERSVEDEVGGGDPPGGSQTGETPGHQTKLNIPLLDLGGGIKIRDNGVIGSMTPGAWDGTGGMPTIPGGSIPGGDTPTGDGTGGDGTGTPAGDGTGTPAGDGTGTGDTTGTPTGDGTGTSTGGTDIPVTPDPPPVIEVPPTSSGPDLVDGNPTCRDLFDVTTATLRIERLKDDTYSSSDATFSVNVTFAKSTLDYEKATATLLGVIVKGGPHANVYKWGKTEATGLSTPAGEEISHVDFCYRD